MRRDHNKAGLAVLLACATVAAVIVLVQGPSARTGGGRIEAGIEQKGGPVGSAPPASEPFGQPDIPPPSMKISDAAPGPPVPSASGATPSTGPPSPGVSGGQPAGAAEPEVPPSSAGPTGQAPGRAASPVGPPASSPVAAPANSAPSGSVTTTLAGPAAPAPGGGPTTGGGGPAATSSVPPRSVPTSGPSGTSAPAAPAAPTSTAGVPAGAQPLGRGGSWKLIFSDDFNGSALDTSRWEPGWFRGSGFSQPVNDDEAGCYHPDQVRVGGGVVELVAESTTAAGCVKVDGSPAKYMSGLINTRNGFRFTYGYMEARIRLAGSGSLQNWPAFWTNGDSWPQTGEIDVMEGLETNRPCFSYHWSTAAGHQSRTGCQNSGDPTGWHVFAAAWEKDRITYYYDGVEVGSYTDGIVGNSQYLILNQGLNANSPIVVPSSVQVDYVKVWQSG